ncbi:unnamed protein product [Hyaloperonospora brassicae]|uniref:RAVE complex protein Rav1 C-terminal domain-containing protein n=1 Tax=Hyaloperonospora brassicae TaxID=162125 RepID=A0AAV0UJ78_HYABA|nr:unnamed protein product [Hyaloperonospora brassicae]
MALRAWSWTRIDGRNVLAIPTQTEIRLYDSDEFILLSRLAPSGHRSPVAFVRWSAFHGKLASLSATRIVVHAPQRDVQQQQQHSSVQFVAVCYFELDVVHTTIRGLAFSRNANELLFCGRDVGVGKLDVRGVTCDARTNQAPVLWEVNARGIDVAKYSPSAFVLATLVTNDLAVHVWRMKRSVGDADETQTLDKKEALQHDVPVVYFSWKPATTQWHSALEADGTRRAQWFEPARILLTCTVTRTVCVWTEREDACFQRVLTFEPTWVMDNVRWVVSKNRNISDEKDCRATDDGQGKDVEWISGVDQMGVLRLWKLVGVMTSTSPTVEETPLQIQVHGKKDDQLDVDRSVRLADVCVMAYFSQTYVGMPSKLDIVLQRMDHIMLSFNVAVGEGDRPSHIVKKSWYRSHLGSISALSAHPSLPLIASVDAYTSERDSARRYDILVYWISFSAFSAETRLIPSGVLPCEKDSGNVLCVQWVPTLHFDATPLLLVAFESGVIDVFGRSAEADVSVVSSPRMQLHRQQQQQERTCSPSLSPSTRYNNAAGKSSSEYEVSCEKPSSFDLDVQFEEREGRLIVRRNRSSDKCIRDVIVDRPDELQIFEAESGLGILRAEESITSNGRGNISGFSWCNSHVEFNVDALAWDEPGSHLQRSMDWKAIESPQKLPMWHPYVLLTTMFGMHARVGEKDTLLAGDSASYAFSRAFSDATQMLKLLARVLQDEHSARASASSGVFSYTSPDRAQGAAAKQPTPDHARGLDYVGRYSTAIHRSDKIDKAENLFAAPVSSSSQRRRIPDEIKFYFDEEDQRALAPDEAAVISGAVDSMLLGKAHPLQANASTLFASFGEEHLLEMKVILSFVNAIQSLGFDLDASAADLGAKRYFSMYLFAKSLRSVVRAHVGNCNSNPQNGDADPLPTKSEWRNTQNEREGCSRLPGLEEIPSSGLLWALHSDAQQFLWEHCIKPGMQWDDIRPQWLGLWIKDVQDLRGIVERFARVSYMRSKDAMGVSLLYVALGKKNVLSALAKLSQSRSNKSLASFLDNDFSQKRWSNAAVKNAYSLLSKKKYEAAASFFLLCEPPRIKDAVRVLAVRQGDPSLALIISRLVEYRADGDHAFTSQTGITPAGIITKKLLEQDVLPLFRRKCEVWLESCALWWLEEFEQAWAVLLPQFQDVDVCQVNNKLTLPTEEILLTNVMRATHFYVNLTSLTIYFQHLHSNVSSILLSWAKQKMHQRVFPDAPALPALASSGKRRLQLASAADIEHAFSFAAYVCKRNGLSDTALVEMLQARHLVNLHARFEISAIEASSVALSDAILEGDSTSLFDDPTSAKNQVLRTRWRQANKPSSFTSPTANRSTSRAAWITPRRRMSFMDTVCPPCTEVQMAEKKVPPRRSRASSLSWKSLQSDNPIPTAPWLKAQIADIECRRWASSAFVGKMIGIRVAREMISHFRAELDVYFRRGGDNNSSSHASAIATTSVQRHHHRVKLHRQFLDELCTPLCEQFQVDRNYVYEAGLAVMHPHAHLHIVEVCFLLSELGRTSTLRKWIEYVSLSMLHSCYTFASCSIAEDTYRDWESLTIQLCYILNLDSQGQIRVPPQVIAHISVAVRTGIIFLGWARNRSDIVRQALTLPFSMPDTTQNASTGDASLPLSSFAFENNLHLLRRLLESPPAASGREDRENRMFGGKVGYTFLGAVATRQADGGNISLLSWGGVENAASQNQYKMRKMYTLVLMVSVLRTLNARAAVFLSMYQDVDEDDKKVAEVDIATSLFVPQKLWKVLGDGPLEGIQQWHALIESHLRCELDYNVKEVPCLCGLYGLDTTAFQEAANREKKQPRYQESGSGDGEELTSHGATSRNVIDAKSDAKMDDSACAAPAEFGVERTDEDGSPSRLQTFLRETGLSADVHTALVNASDDYVLLLMQNAEFGVRTTLRRFRLDPRVYVKSFVLRDAFNWFAHHHVFSYTTKADFNRQAHAFLSRCCKDRKLRLLVTHRGEDTQMFPDDHRDSRLYRASAANPSSASDELSVCPSRSASAPGLVECDVIPPRSRCPNDAFASERSDIDSLSEATCLQSMMFVDPWEVEAERNVWRYMHHAHSPLHVELGWNRLSPVCLETCDGIINSVFEDSDLVKMWKATAGEGWLVTAITHYQLDGLHSYRTLYQHLERGLAGKDEPRIPFLVEVYSRCQRNAMFEEAGLPHRFVGVVTVELIEAKDLIACSWIGTWSDPFVFLQLSHAKDDLQETADEWSLQTYRSPVGDGGVNPRWSTANNQFVFRFAIPTHRNHAAHPVSGRYFSGGEDRVNSVDPKDARMVSQLWTADVNDRNRAAVVALEKLLPSAFPGPPALLRCTMYHKNKVLNHQFMGRAKVCLNELTSSNEMDCWLPLEDTTSGSLHVKISLSFQLMCSSMAGR